MASIGTGASAIQYVPAIQERVAKLHVFQRTAPWVLPHGNRPISDRERAAVPAVSDRAEADPRSASTGAKSCSCSASPSDRG